jgi:hypothetical protein
MAQPGGTGTRTRIDSASAATLANGRECSSGCAVYHEIGPRHELSPPKCASAHGSQRGQRSGARMRVGNANANATLPVRCWCEGTQKRDTSPWGGVKYCRVPLSTLDTAGPDRKVPTTVASGACVPPGQCCCSHAALEALRERPTDLGEITGMRLDSSSNASDCLRNDASMNGFNRTDFCAIVRRPTRNGTACDGSSRARR